MRALLTILLLSPICLFSQMELAIIELDGKFGIQLQDRWILKPEYDSVVKIADNCFVSKKNGRYGLVREKKIVGLTVYGHTGCQFSGFKSYQDPAAPYQSIFALKNRKTGLFAFYDHHGAQTSRFEFEEVQLASGFSFCRKPEENWHIWDGDELEYGFYADSAIVVNPHYGLGFTGKKPDGTYQTITVLNYGTRADLEYDPDWGKKKLVAVSTTKWYGFYYKHFVDENGIAEREGFKTVSLWPGGFFLVQNHSGFFGVRDSSHNWVLACGYADSSLIEKKGNYFIVIGEHRRFLANQLKSLSYSLYDYENKTWRLTDVYNFYPLHNGAFAFQPYEKSAPVIYFTADNSQMETRAIADVGYGIHRVDVHNSYYYVDSTGKKSIDFSIWSHGESGTLDGLLLMAKVVTVFPLFIFNDPPPYNAGGPFRDGYARVNHGSGETLRFGFIDTSLQIKIPVVYEAASDFEFGVAFVSVDGKWGIINKHNEFVARPEYEHFQFFTEELIIATREKNKKYELLSTTGKKLDYPPFSFYSQAENGDLFITPIKPTGNHTTYRITKSGEMLPVSNEE